MSVNAATLKTASPRVRPWRTGVVGALPNILVFALLGAVMYLGHHSGWKLPKKSELFGGASPTADDWCAEHLVPEAICVECNPELFERPAETGFCRTHGVAPCVIDHPELAQVTGEVQLPRYDVAAALAVVQRPTNNSRNTLHTRLVQFASAEAAAKAGVDVDVAFERPMSDAVTASGELSFDPRRVAHLSAKAPGTVSVVLKNVGDEVEAGEVLALVDAALVGQAKANLLQSIVQLQLKKNTVTRLASVANSGAVPGRLIIEAESEKQEAEIEFISSRQALTNLGMEPPEELESRDASEVSDELRFLGLPDPIAANLPAGTKTANLIPVRAPYSGVIVASDIVAGEVVSNSEVLFTVADPAQLWLILSVRQEDAKYVKRDLPVRFQPDDGGDVVTGKVSWISPAVDEQTRTLEVRVTIENPNGTLRDKTFGSGEVVLREEPNAVVVPAAAVQATTDAQFVFVRDKGFLKDGAPKVYHVRQVRTGARDAQYVEILAGVLPGEVVAVKGSAVLLAQLLRSSLGAGCGCYED